MQRLPARFFVVLPALALAACSSPQKAYIPVDSALRTWQPPEADTYAPPPAPAAAPPAAAKEAAKKK
jgi:hypothetical protein